MCRERLGSEAGALARDESALGRTQAQLDEHTFPPEHAGWQQGGGGGLTKGVISRGAVTRAPS
jgi:hypothetical protein